MVSVAQSVELWIVVPAVVGSSPIAHPNSQPSMQALAFRARVVLAPSTVRGLTAFDGFFTFGCATGEVSARPGEKNHTHGLETGVRFAHTVIQPSDNTMRRRGKGNVRYAQARTP